MQYSQIECVVCPDIRFCNWTILFRGSHSKRSIVPEHAAKLCNHMNTTRVLLPARRSPSTLCQHSESLSRSAVSRQMDWEKGSYRMAFKVTRFDPCRFLSMGVHKRPGVPNEGARCGRTALPNNAACETVTPVMLQNTWREGEYCLDICRETKGTHVEIY
jgi:hypothetical protein